MPELLALPRYAIVKRQADSGSNGTILIGTGSYKLNQWQAGEHAQFTANEDYWGGRPFADAIEFQMGASLHDQLMDRQLGSFAATELSVDQIRNVEQNNQMVMLSRSADLMALVFLQPDSGGRSGRKPVDARVRQALGLTINRAAISNVIFQRKATPASGLLPQWLTGYEFMFSSAQDLNRAKELRADAAAYSRRRQRQVKNTNNVRKGGRPAPRETDAAAKGSFTLSPARARPRDIDESALPLAGSNDRQHFRPIKSGRDILPPIKGDAIARREPPENSMHAVAGLRCNRGIAIRGDDEAVVFEAGNAKRDGFRRMLTHYRAMHVRAIGEVQHCD